ncbi:Pol-polyprotein [Rhynchospora pubera]|uniref:Pol-polyprotein n=1 Tax=Rhynchospora pubera TaxID=906938 RepID=A0AAV8CT17_9POAL|nr:Pol-polyprotein [Rhynchospora pubera]
MDENRSAIQPRRLDLEFATDKLNKEKHRVLLGARSESQTQIELSTPQAPGDAIQPSQPDLMNAEIQNKQNAETSKTQTVVGDSTTRPVNPEQPDNDTPLDLGSTRAMPVVIHPILQAVQSREESARTAPVVLHPILQAIQQPREEPRLERPETSTAKQRSTTNSENQRSLSQADLTNLVEQTLQAAFTSVTPTPTVQFNPPRPETQDPRQMPSVTQPPQGYGYVADPRQSVAWRAGTPQMYNVEQPPHMFQWHPTGYVQHTIPQAHMIDWYPPQNTYGFPRPEAPSTYFPWGHPAQWGTHNSWNTPNPYSWTRPPQQPEHPRPQTIPRPPENIIPTNPSPSLAVPVPTLPAPQVNQEPLGSRVERTRAPQTGEDREVMSGRNLNNERREREEKRSPRGRAKTRQRREHSSDSARESEGSGSPPVGALARRLYQGARIDMKNYPHLDRYPGGEAKDAQAFVNSFRAMMAITHASDRVMCLVFPTRLTESAWEWYSQLPRGSIHNFDDLTDKFLGRFGGLRAPTIKCTSLMTLKQEPYESSRAYLARFSEEAYKVSDFDEKLVLAAVLQGIRSKNLRYELIKKDCGSFREFRECAQQVIQAEEDAERMGWQDVTERRITTPTRRSCSPLPQPRNGSPSGRRRNAKVIKGATYKLHNYRKTGEAYAPLYSTYHICTEPRKRLFNVIKDSKELQQPEPLVEAEKFDKSAYCDYHRSSGHRTRDCLKLKDEIERLIRHTHLLEKYIEKEGAKDNRTRESFNNQWQRKPYNNQWKRTDNRNNPNNIPIQRQNVPNKPREENKGSPVVMFIAGGDASGGDKPHQRASYADPRRLSQPSRYEIFHLHAEGSLTNTRISFGPEDCVGVRYPHDDAIVLMLRIHGRRVKRILVDTGSSADVLYFDALRQLNLASYPLTPMDTPLVGFAGDTVIPLGTIDLEVEFGEPPNSVVSRVKFIVVNAPSAYNVILGRKSLNDVGAIASTKHLMIKFPTRLGVGVVKGDQQKARECYQAAVIDQVTQIEKGNVEKKVRVPCSGAPGEDVEEVELSEGIITKLGTALGAKDRELVKDCLKKNQEIFVAEGGQMPGIKREIVEHKIKLFPHAKPVHQKKRKFGPERRTIIEEEVQRLLAAGFIREVKCPAWLANPVVVPKPNNKWRVCIDFTDLNKACPKDPFPLPNIDALVDSTAGFSHLSIVDANAGYHQIKMCTEDEEKTSFLTEKGIYCYKVMPFGLKNAGAEYQRMVNKLFQGEIGKIMEAYVDDMVIKSCSGEEHVQHLERVFAKMKEVGMRLNPKKSFFCLGSGKFLGFIVSERGIEVHPSKCQAIANMEPQKTVKEVQELTGRIAALNRFISKSAEVCQPFFQTIRKNKKFQWTVECQDAFEKIKEYLATPPTISRPVKGETLYLYVATSETAVSAALIRIEENQQRPVYFVSRILRDAEIRYPPVEKVAFAVMIASRKLKPYFQAHPIKVLTDMPLRKALGQLDVAGRMLKWAVELSEYDVSFEPRTAYKGQILADFIVECTARQTENPKEEVWEVFVDGAASEKGSGVGVEIKGPKGEKFHYAIHLTFEVSNNVAEYEALLAGMRLMEAIGAKSVRFYMDSQLVVNQIKGEYAAINERLALYLEKVKTVLAAFESASVEYVPRTQNETADALSKIAKESDLDREKPIVMLEVPHPSIDVLAFEVYIVEAGKEWYALLWNFLKEGKLPEEDKVARKVKRWALEFTIRDGLLLKKGYGIPWLTCVGRAKADEIIAEVHEGICGSHQGITSLGRRIVRAGFYWPSLKKDVETYVRRCEKCQFHARIPRQPPHPMQSISSSWPFDVWGLDLLGPFPQGQGNVKFLVVAVEYFTKWIEAKPLATITSQKIVDFARHQIVYRYGIPHTFISDNGTQFTGAPFQDFCKGLGIRSCTSSVCHPQSNGLAEVSNRTILEGLKRKIEGSKNSWPEYLDEILWAYRTTPRSSTDRSPFSMIYGMEAVTPMEAVHPTLRTKSYTWEKNGTRREEDLETIYELREEARVKMEEYQRRMRRGFDKKVAPKHFQPGDWVLRKIEATGKQVGKLDPAWEGPFEIIKSIEGRAYHLRDMRGKRIPNAWNAAHLRKFYV